MHDLGAVVKMKVVRMVLMMVLHKVECFELFWGFGLVSNKQTVISDSRIDFETVNIIFTI